MSSFGFWGSKSARPAIGGPIRSIRKPPKRVSPLDEDSDERLNREPEEYASEMMQLEIKAEDPGVSIEVVQKLMGLYSQAIDYYVSIGSDKYKYFKKKIANLMIQPQVVECMEVNYQKRRIESDRNISSFSSEQHKFNLESLLKPDYKKVDLAMKRQEFEVAKDLGNLTKFDKLKELVRSHELSTTKNHVIVQSNLMDQLESLKRKLITRKENNKASNGSTVSGFSTIKGNLQSGKADESIKSTSQERQSIRDDPVQEPQLKLKIGLKRCGSHKVYSSNTQPPSSIAGNSNAGQFK